MLQTRLQAVSARPAPLQAARPAVRQDPARGMGQAQGQQCWDFEPCKFPAWPKHPSLHPFLEPQLEQGPVIATRSSGAAVLGF